MKIIGGKKDYYDYLVSYYGYDDHIVYDRRKTGEIDIKWADRFLFFICGEVIPVIKKGRDLIFDADDSRLTNSWKNQFEKEWMLKWKKQTKINAEMRQPVLCTVRTMRNEKKEYFIPCLADFGFAAKIEAHEMYERIYAFLGWLKDNPAPPDNQTDKEKIVSHGFSTRESFRPKIKN
jgi:hypothetical protein